MSSSPLIKEKDRYLTAKISDAEIRSDVEPTPTTFKLLYLLTGSMIIGLPLLMGAKDPASEALIKLLAFSTLLAVIFAQTKDSLTATVSSLRPLLTPFALCLAIFLLQLTPLPLALLEIISPKTADLYSAAEATSGRLSLSPYDTASQSWWLLAIISLLIVGCCATDHFKTISKKLNRISSVTTFNPFALFFILGATICTAIALAHWASGAESYFGIFGQDRSGQTRRAHWPFVNPNHLSIYLQIGFTLCLGIFLDQCSSIKQRLNARLYRRRHATGREVKLDVVFAFTFGLIAFFLAVGNLLTGSRMGNVLLLLGSAALLIYHFKSDKEAGLVSVLPLLNRPLSTKTKKIATLCAILILIAAVIVISGQSGQQLAKERVAYGLTTSFDDVRLILFKSSLSLFLDFPLLGVGLGAWHIAASGYIPNELAGFRLDYTHNDALQFLTETGAIGALLLLLIIRNLYARLKTHWQNLHLSATKRGFTTTLTALLLPLLHSSVDFPFHIPALTVAITLLAAPLLLPPKEESITPAHRHFNN